MKGTVQQLAVFTAGGVVISAQALMVIVPAAHDISAEVMVANENIGFIHTGQKVRIKLETFNFTRYGTIDGEVTWVSADALTSDPQNSNSANNPASNGQAPLAYFPAHVKVNKQTIDVEGKTMPVTPGAKHYCGNQDQRRTVLDYLLSPIQKTIDESVGER
ncbi:HlyD family efflux transporter periplasmic adaptor subunit [Rhodoferax sp.]|uniref:HlyD family efflux transporter periplasmic adaptor subunit n=1 Tax=Rhodoferax sp. TaxID=50421 RepID=UPI002ACEF022|nr:HlyD family efflux transporter periplasmic adaptor subunit [Rhodoferax sp.]